MIGISKLYCGTVEPSDALRYGGRNVPHHLIQFQRDKKPVVVWNCTRRCNLRCAHCYAHSADMEYEGELTTEEAMRMIDDLASFGAPVLLFSGGEPLKRGDVFDLIKYATEKKLRAVLSTNGTLITSEVAARLKEASAAYVGVSLDGLRETNDRFRRVEGAFDDALRGIRAARDAGLKVGIRFTMTRHNVEDVPGIFRLAEDEGVPRVCFYHLVYAGRGSNLIKDDLSKDETRRVVDLIMDRTKEMHDRGVAKEVLTVDNHSDGPYLYMRLQRENPERAEKVLELLKLNGGNSAGVGIGCIDNRGDVHADQFWQHYSFGNIRQRPFSEIWMDTSDPIMAGLKEKKKHVKGRCSKCKWLDVCGGNSRVRAEAVTGDVWAEEPACYLTDREIGVA